MYVVKKLRLNQFKAVSIPSSKDMFLRMGLRSNPNVQDGQVANFASSTMEQLDSLEAQVLKDSQMPLDANV